MQRSELALAGGWLYLARVHPPGPARMRVTGLEGTVQPFRSRDGARLLDDGGASVAPEALTARSGAAALRPSRPS